VGDPVSVASNPERLSTPVAPGAVQVAGGQLIVLGVACGTMGGYPHMAHVVSADLDRLGQLKAGDVIRFEYVTIEQARRVLWEARDERRALIRRVSVMSQDG
jgi:allophanate hydrolase subunit 2